MNDPDRSPTAPETVHERPGAPFTNGGSRRIDSSRERQADLAADVEMWLGQMLEESPEDLPSAAKLGLKYGKSKGWGHLRLTAARERSAGDPGWWRPLPVSAGDVEQTVAV